MTDDLAAEGDRLHAEMAELIHAGFGWAVDLIGALRAQVDAALRERDVAIRARDVAQNEWRCANEQRDALRIEVAEAVENKTAAYAALDAAEEQRDDYLASLAEATQNWERDRVRCAAAEADADQRFINGYIAADNGLDLDEALAADRAERGAAVEALTDLPAEGDVLYNAMSSLDPGSSPKFWLWAQDNWPAIAAALCTVEEREHYAATRDERITELLRERDEWKDAYSIQQARREERDALRARCDTAEAPYHSMRNRYELGETKIVLEYRGPAARREAWEALAAHAAVVEARRPTPEATP